MRRILWAVLVIFLAAVSSGCAGGVYNVPKDQYQSIVKTLGILPLMVDSGSAIRHPESGQVIDLLRRNNVGKEEVLIELLREKKAYFDVRAVPGSLRSCCARLLSRVRLQKMRTEAIFIVSVLPQ